MGRKKQIRPHRSIEPLEKQDIGVAQFPSLDEHISVENGDFFVQVDRCSWNSKAHRDISEISLNDLSFGNDFSRCVDGDFYQDSRFSLRFRLCNLDRSVRKLIKFGKWPVLCSSAGSVVLELVEKNTMLESVDETVIMSGKFDGPDEGVSGLVHLASLKFVSLRPIIGVLSRRFRVEILESAFDACGSLLEVTKKSWKKSMMSVMAWLRPEVTTSEARYKVGHSKDMEFGLRSESADDNSISGKQGCFDAAEFYEAIKPLKENPMIEDDIPGLLPKLRPYQRRAAYWMVQREKGDSGSLNKKDTTIWSPLCTPVDFVDSCSRMFYNPFSGSVSLCVEYSSEYVFGGILADEMGMGKTVELLTCIFAHRKYSSGDTTFYDDALQGIGDQENKLQSVKKERVECICGAVVENHKYKGLWVQCDTCYAWQHADCVGYSPREKSLKSKKLFTVSEMDEIYMCQMCLESIKAINSPIATGASLIVCPASILLQWHAEIIRHTEPGSLKTVVYEGVKNNSTSSAVVDINDLITADIVLTTYDVLKEDLSHDSDRHKGDHHSLRFQKRYPVIPTLLTKIFWWRICLDEGQMVERDGAAATEMALRLHAKNRWCITGTPIQRKLDDLHGLLRFLKVGPFDALRWWTEVIRDPYEKRDIGAMGFTHSFFKNIMWRSSKVHVGDELDIPPQEECLSWISLSPIEDHFYQRQHETCVTYAREVVETFKKDMLKRGHQGFDSSEATYDPYITQLEAAKLLNSLLKLRQACCHPQVGSSGLRSLHQSPMTMEEILQVLVGKTMIEGEEALRRIVSAMNGLAGIALIKQNVSEAVSLYKEALDLTKEHSEDFRLDPLLNLHIHHNLCWILVENASQFDIVEDCDQPAVKRQKMSGIDCSNLNRNAERENDMESRISSYSPADGCLRTACENIKNKYLFTFSSRLSLAQQEFRKSYTQVCDELNNIKDQPATWWLEALQLIEYNSDSNELIKKIGDAISGSLHSSRSTRNASTFRSVSALKYHIQTGLDAMEASRKLLIDRLLEVDQTLEEPREEDILSLRYCPNCQAIADGPLCVHCTIDELFQAYEARLFRLNKAGGGMIASAEEAVNLQKKSSALNRFYSNLSQPNQISISSTIDKENNRRDVGEKIVVSKSPSEFEIILGVIKSYSRCRLGREGKTEATKQLLVLEGMRKEYAYARSLAIAQAQFLRAHDEMKMATSRLRLKENENDKSIDALSVEELDVANIDFTHGKFLALTSLSSIKGQLRYLKGLVTSKQKMIKKIPGDSSMSHDAATSMISPPVKEKNTTAETDEEECPVCQEKLSNSKMVFPCGHVTCCKCFFEMTERRVPHRRKIQDKWVMCPTCRQNSNTENIAYANDGQKDGGNKLCNSSMLPTFQAYENSESSIIVRGSYGTKLEAVIRRILWIKSKDPKAKVLVFTSWNDVLDVLEHGLTANDIIYTRMKGGRKSHFAISHFRGQDGSERGSKYVQVLLLLIQHGANGLNLLEAHHVILIEPLLNPAAEAQAINRVHRIGQEHRTLVHRFLVKGTVEEGIFKLNRSKNTSSFISGSRKNEDQPILTLKDVESLFAAVPSKLPECNEIPAESLKHLPPSVAAGIAAERRLKEDQHDT